MKFIVAAILCLFDIAATAQVSWYKCLSAKIDQYPVTIHLHKRLHQYSGYYYYNRTQEPIYFLGEDSSVAGKIKLTAILPDRDEEENLIFALTEKGCTGSWIAAGKTLAFSAAEIMQLPSWDYIFAKGSVKLRPDKQDSPAAGYEAASVWPRGHSDQSIFLKKMINEWYAKDSSATDIGQLFLQQKKQFFDDYLFQNKDVPDADLVDAYSYNADETQIIAVAYQSATLLTLAGSFYSYTGGAHGNYGTNYRSVDLVRNKKISLSDILTDPGKKQLTMLLEKYFRKKYSLKDTEALTEGGLFENKIEPNENFFVTGKGIGFDYSPYEIGPYAMGEIVIFIPFTELSAYLQSDYKSLASD